MFLGIRLFSKGNAKLGKNTPRTHVLEHHGNVLENTEEDTCMEHAVFWGFVLL